MGKARIVDGGSGGLYTISVSYDTKRIDKKLVDIAATLPVIQAELDALDTQLTTARADLTAAVAAMNAQINLINANKPFDGAYIDGLIGDMQDATSAIENKNIEIDDAYQTLNGYESAIDAATQDETAKRADYQQAQAALSAYVAETGDTSSGLYLSMVAGVEIKLAAYQDAQQFTLDTKAVFEPQIATQKAEIETLKNQLKTLRDEYKAINAEFVAVTQAMEAWSNQDQGAIDAAGKMAIEANAKYVVTKFKRDEKKREVTELTQEQKWLGKSKTTDMRQAWCADHTTNLAAGSDVGTIEIAQEQADVPMIIRPGYNGGAAYGGARDGALHKLQNMSAESAWFNMALYPALAKWQPQYRRGTLTAKSSNLGTVALDATYSSATKTVGGITRIAINQSPTVLTNVPIVYMTCNGGAFNVNDRVVVEFQGRDWSQPRIIGFVDNPRPCPTTPTPTPTPGPIYWPDLDVYQLLTRGSETLDVSGPAIGAWDCGRLWMQRRIFVSCPPINHSWGFFSVSTSTVVLEHTFDTYTDAGLFYDYEGETILGVNDSTIPSYNKQQILKDRRTLSGTSSSCGAGAYATAGTRTSTGESFDVAFNPVIVTMTYSSPSRTETHPYYMLLDRTASYSSRHYVLFRPVPV